jgi:glycosyltransferase involved in cell wall biosynthesis
MAGDPHIFGGGKRGFLQLMSYLDKNLFKVYSCCALSEDQENALISLNVKIVRIDVQHGMILPAIRKLAKFLRSEKIDIIHSQGARADVFGRVGAILAGNRIKTVNTIQMLVEGYDVQLLKKMVYCCLDRVTERCVDKFIVVSEMLKNRLINAHKIDEKKIKKIYNGIELNQYHQKCGYDLSSKLISELSIQPTDFVEKAIGRFMREARDGR